MGRLGPKPRRPSLDEVRTAFQAAEAAPTEACPEPSELFEAALGALPAERVRVLVDHVATCPACAEAWRSATATPAGVVERVRGPRGAR